MSKIGYIRVSTEHQETARQQEIMSNYKVDRIFSEKLSGANADRPQLRAMLDYVRGNLCSPCSPPSLSLKGSRSDSDSVRASRSQRHRASTPDGNLSPPTGQGSGSSMGNGEPSALRAETLCGEWICQPIHSIAVCVSMKSVIVSPSKLLLDNSCQRNGEATQRPPPLRSGKLTTEKKKPSETLAGRSRELAVSNSVPVGFVLIVVCSTITIMTCAERFLSVPIG